MSPAAPAPMMSLILRDGQRTTNDLGLLAQSFPNAEQVRQITAAFIEEQGGPEEQFDAVCQLFDAAVANHEAYEEVALEAWAIMEARKLWQTRFPTRSEAHRILNTPAMQALRNGATARRRRKDKASQQIRSAWGAGVADWHFEGLSEHALEYIAMASTQYSIEDATRLVTQITMQRLHQSKAGRGSSRSVLASDWKELSKIDAGRRQGLLNLPFPDAAELAALQIESTVFDLSQTPGAPLAGSEQDPNPVPTKRRRYALRARPSRAPQDDSHSAGSEGSDAGDGSPSGSRTERSDGGSSMGSTGQPPRRIASSRADTSAASEGGGPGGREEDGGGGGTALAGSPEVGNRGGDDGEGEEGGGGGGSGGARMEVGGEPPGVGAVPRTDLSTGTSIPGDGASSVPSCCPTVSKYTLDRLDREAAGEARMLGQTEITGTLATLLTVDGKRRSNFRHICYRHLFKVGGKLGLRVNELRKEHLEHRIRICWEQRNRWEDLLNDRATCFWFRLSDRPWQEEDVRGVFAHEAIAMDFVKPVSPERAQAILQEFGGEGAWARWLQDGNLVLPDLFAWLWDGITLDGVTEPGIGDLIETEFDIYLHHQTTRNGKKNLGWLRTMVHSLSQQIIRQDVSYWLLYVCLRPDRNHRLVSFPYYNKYAVEADQTAFRHIDMNIPRYLDHQRGANIIQGSVSLNDETEAHCTVLIPGFHRHIASWWGQVRSRGSEPDGWVTGLEKIWTADDVSAYGDFVPVPVPRGGVRISRPELPHGSTTNDDGSARRTILPWFVGVRKDGQTLDNIESDTWRDLAYAHATHTAPRNSPSGWPNFYGSIPYRFAASTHLQLESPISNALICRAQWVDPLVQEAALVLLGEDRSRAQRAVLLHRHDALRSFKRAFATMAAAERKAFGPNSFFKAKR